MTMRVLSVGKNVKIRGDKRDLVEVCVQELHVLRLLD
jgi:hypothetical protein